ncbi:hypothetical protein [uncultured Oscillibacter sp.]|uniref:hypothetical protein n=1 Tax=uncultured Oscillibacter sp. TaxID=876091 RepID=UPI0025FEE145|nr:hypothetical protein [uncultured Oscillibacter sp.]
MKLKQPLNGTNPLLTLIDLIGVAEVVLLASFTMAGGRVAFPYFLYQGWLCYLLLSRNLGYAMIFQDGIGTRGKNPALKPKAGVWFLALFLPQVLFSAAMPFVVFLLGGLFRCAAAAVLLGLKILLMRRVWPMLRVPETREAGAE